MASSIQFIKGIKEPTVPDVKLTRARDGSSGTASFTFKEPSVFEADNQLGDITGMYLVDDEGTLSTVDVQAKFLNGKQDRIEAKYLMRSGFEWDRCETRPMHAPSCCLLSSKQYRGQGLAGHNDVAVCLLKKPSRTLAGSR